MTIKSDKLKGNKTDTWAAISKAVAGTVPIIGPSLTEIVSSLIPNQRLDRVCNFLREAEKRLTKLELEQLKQNTLALDLFEDAAVAASRALTDVRNKYIVSFMKSSVSTDATEYEFKKKLLYILQNLTDQDIEILRSIQIRGYQCVALENFSNSITIAAFDELSDHEKVEYHSRQEAWPLHITTLERNGLLKAYREAQDLDNTHHHIDLETGLPKISSYETSTLGDVFLSLISDK